VKSPACPARVLERGRIPVAPISICDKDERMTQLLNVLRRNRTAIRLRSTDDVSFASDDPKQTRWFQIASRKGLFPGSAQQFERPVTVAHRANLFPRITDSGGLWLGGDSHPPAASLARLPRHREPALVIVSAFKQCGDGGASTHSASIGKQA
jgi:hypothetical protein